MKNENGEWVEDREKLMSMDVDFFENLNRTEGAVRSDFPVKNGFPNINKDRLSSIGKPFTKKEIEEAMFGIGAFKDHRLSGIFFS